MPPAISSHQILPLSVHVGAKNSLNLRMPETNGIQGGSMQPPQQLLFGIFRISDSWALFAESSYNPTLGLLENLIIATGVSSRMLTQGIASTTIYSQRESFHYLLATPQPSCFQKSTLGIYSLYSIGTDVHVLLYRIPQSSVYRKFNQSISRTNLYQIIDHRLPTRQQYLVKGNLSSLEYLEQQESLRVP